MKLKRYWDYFKYVIEHKKNVFIECWKDGLYLQAFTHDLSKFSPTEFFSYANYFYGNKEDTSNKIAFEYGWLHHQKKNKHHWEYWVDSDGKALEIPSKYIKEMICDWKAMSRKFGGTVQEYYYKNINKANLHISTRCRLEYELGFIDGCCLISNVTWQDYCHRRKVSLEEDLKYIM